MDGGRFLALTPFLNSILGKCRLPSRFRGKEKTVSFRNFILRNFRPELTQFPCQTIQSDVIAIRPTYAQDTGMYAWQRFPIIQ